MKRCEHWLLWLYPQAWRVRYEDEFLAVLEACPFSLWTLWDVFLGAIDARLHLETVTGRMFPVMNKLRTTEVTVFCAYIAFVVAGLAFGKMVEYDDFTALRDSNTGVAISYWTLYAGAFAALLAVLVGGLPIAYAAARSAIAARHWRLLSLFAVPPVSLALWIAWLFTVEALNPHPAAVLTRSILSRVLTGLGVFGLFGLAAVLSTAAVCIIVVRSEIDIKIFHFARIPAIITALAMVLMFGAVLAYGLVASAADPPLFAENNGIMATNTTLTWLLILAAMAIATVIAIAALIRGRSSGAAAPTPTMVHQPAG